MDLKEAKEMAEAVGKATGWNITGMGEAIAEDAMNQAEEEDEAQVGVEDFLDASLEEEGHTVGTRAGDEYSLVMGAVESYARAIIEARYEED